MASVGGTPAKGRRKSLDAELNLVPFIDLLSMCICFLLMTAVWMEIGGVNIKQIVGTEASAPTPNTYEMDVKYINAENLEVNVKSAGKQAQVFAVTGATSDQRLSQLRNVLTGLTQRLVPTAAPGGAPPKLGQVVTTAKVTTFAGISYGEIVTMMDALRDFGIVSLGLVPVRQ